MIFCLLIAFLLCWLILSFDHLFFNVSRGLSLGDKKAMQVHALLSVHTVWKQHAITNQQESEKEAHDWLLNVMYIDICGMNS